jgi:hypothetical protein
MVPEEDSKVQAIDLIIKDKFPRGDQDAPNGAPTITFTEGSSPNRVLSCSKMAENWDSSDFDLVDFSLNCKTWLSASILMPPSGGKVRPPKSEISVYSQEVIGNRFCSQNAPIWKDSYGN